MFKNEPTHKTGVSFGESAGVVNTADLPTSVMSPSMSGLTCMSQEWRMFLEEERSLFSSLLQTGPPG